MSSPKTWTVVMFEADNSVQAVPSKWIHGDNNCLWPVFPQDKLMRALRNCDFNSHWPSHTIRIFRNATYDDYALARSKAAKAEYCSDLASEEDQPRPRKRRVISSSESEDEVEKKQNKRKLNKTQQIPNPPPPPSNWSLEECVDNSEVVKTSSRVATPFVAEHKDVNKNTTPRILVDPEKRQTPVLFEHNPNSTVDMNDTTPRIRHVVKGKENTSGPTLCHCKPILLNIQSLLLDLHAKVDRLESKSTGIEVSETGNILQQSEIDFPIQTEENLTKFEDLLKSDDNFKSLVSFLSRMGGVNLYDFIKRCAREILSDELATEFSFIGRKGKKKFYSLSISRALIESAEKAGMSKTTKETELAIGGWLRKAKFRKK